jgi:transposase
MKDSIPAPKKTYRRRKGDRIPRGLNIVNRKAGGIDIGSQRHYVCAADGEGNLLVENFGCFTDDLRSMAQWLRDHGVETVVMESTGSYWIPVYRFLEEMKFDVQLVDARHVKYVPGRKTDVLDCQWLQKLHTFGLLSSAFVPDREIIGLRQLWRWRKTLVEACAEKIQHMQRALTEMNLHLQVVLSDITGVSGMAIIRAILDGQRDPVILAQLAHPSVKSPKDEIAKALDGCYRSEQIFILRQAVAAFDYYQQQIEACDGQIQEELKNFHRKADAKDFKSTKKKKGKRRKNQPHVDLAAELYSILGVDLTSIDSIDASTAFTIISEIGTDIDRFPTMKRFTSWVGLSPNHEITGGNVKRRRTKKTRNRVAQALRVAAQSLWRSKTYLGAYFRRMHARLGPKKAITATAHKLARIIYNLLKHGQSYVDKGQAHEEQQHKERNYRRLQKLARQQGYDLVDQATGELIECQVH